MNGYIKFVRSDGLIEYRHPQYDHLVAQIPQKPPENHPVIPQEELDRHEAEKYKYQRETEYPPMAEYLDAVVKGDQAQMHAYIEKCLAVKAKYPKPTQE